MAKHPKEEKPTWSASWRPPASPAPPMGPPAQGGGSLTGSPPPSSWASPRSRSLKPWWPRGLRGAPCLCIPVAETLDLKKAAKAAGVKSVSMLPQKQLLLTGYVHWEAARRWMVAFPPILPRKSSWWTPWCALPGRWASGGGGPDALIALVGADGRPHRVINPILERFPMQTHIHVKGAAPTI